jgi:hypothetical protein
MQMVMMVFRTSMEGDIVPWIEHEQLPYTRLDGHKARELRAWCLRPSCGAARIASFL